MTTQPPPDGFAKIGLREWPFHVVASEATAHVWVGRAALQRKLTRLRRGAARISNSQIAVMWASFGAGKTHALMHLQRLALDDGGPTPVYVVTPQGIKSF